jgi:hypothetical protein
MAGQQRGCRRQPQVYAHTPRDTFLPHDAGLSCLTLLTQAHQPATTPDRAAPRKRD